MQWLLTPTILSLILAAVASLTIAGYSWQHREEAFPRTFALLMFSITIWSFAYALEISSFTQDAKLFWSKLAYVGIATTPALLLLTAGQYTGYGRRWQQSRLRFLLWVVPSLTLILVWSNELHGLIWQQTSIVEINDGLRVLVVEAYGAGFWLHTAVSYLYLLVGSGLFVHHLMRKQNHFRGQGIIITLGILTPWFANFLYLTNLTPFPNLDLTPYAFTFTGLMLALGILRFQLVDIIPIARSQIVEALPDGVIVLDRANRVVDMNAAGSSIIKTPYKQAVGKPIHQLMPYCQTIISEDPSQHVLTEITPFTDGRIFELSIQPLWTNQNTITGRTVTLHDITDRKQHERALEQARETAVHAQQAAEAANQAKGNFLNVMSHELRTPVAAIVGMSNLLRDTPLNSEQQELNTTISNNSALLLGVVNNLLEYTNVEAGQLTLDIEPFDLRDSLQVMLEPFINQAQRKNLLLTHTVSEKTPNVFAGDVIRIRQILANLLSNAVKFTEEGEITVTVDSKQTTADQYELQIVVADTGVGIPANHLPALFTPFSQADSSLTRNYAGLGLGLAISAKLCELMGGAISVESRENVGASFCVTLPLHCSMQPPVKYLQSTTTNLTGKRLLIIAKDDEQRRIISRETRTAGMQPYVAGSASESFYWLKRDPYDVILIASDILELETNEILNEIREEQPNAPFVLLVGEKTPQTMLKDPRLSGFLGDPITTSNIYQTMLHVLTKQRTPNGNGARPDTGPLAEMSRRHPLRLLLVEDNAVNRKVAQRLLKRLGYALDMAHDGLEGVTAVQHGRYDVVLMDIQMPVMDGLEATRQIREKLPQQQQPRIIAVTAHALEGDRETYLAAGLDDYISKPVQLYALVESLYRCSPLDAEIETDELAETAMLTPAPTSNNQPALAASTPIPNTKLADTIDLAKLEAMVGADVYEFLAEMVPIFLEDTLPLLQRLQDAVTHSDADALRHAAHTLKGTSASLGINKLSSLSKEAEQMGRSGALTQAAAKLAEIEQEYERVKSTLIREYS